MERAQRGKPMRRDAQYGQNLTSGHGSFHITITMMYIMIEYLFCEFQEILSIHHENMMKNNGFGCLLVFLMD